MLSLLIEILVLHQIHAWHASIFLIHFASKLNFFGFKTPNMIKTPNFKQIWNSSVGSRCGGAL
jgi:hypothetical protein